MSFLDKILGFFGGGKSGSQTSTAYSQPTTKPASPAKTAAPAKPASTGQPAPARTGKPVIDRVMVGEALVGDGNEVAHVDLIIGPRGSAAEKAFTHALTNNKDGFTTLLAVVSPNLATKPNTILFNKVTIKGAKQAVQMFGPAQRAVATAVADCVEDGTIPADEADNVFICVGVFIHWEAADDTKIQDFNYEATKLSIKRAVAGEPKVRDVIAKKATAHPFAAHA
jgi:5,6,7,8-tetrahydromethanopterin hydro-lyase